MDPQQNADDQLPDLTPEQDLWDEVTAADDAAVTHSGEEEPPAVDTPPADAQAPAAGDPAPASQAPADQPAEVDPLAGIPEQYRAALMAVPELNQRLRSSEGRIAALQRELAQRAQAPAPMPAAPQSTRLDALRTELPEVADAIEEMRGQMPSVDADALRAQLRDEVLLDLQEELLETQAPDWAARVTSNDFQIWLTTQPAEYRQQVESAKKASTLIGALASFDKHQKAAQARAEQLQGRQRRVSRAAAPNASAGRIPPAPSEEDMTEDELWDHITR